MTANQIRELYDFDKWATDCTLDSVSLIGDADFRKDLQSSHGGIHGTLVHIYFADWVWLERWNGNSPTSAPSTAEIPSLNDLRQRWSQYRLDLQKFLSILTDQRLLTSLSYKDLKGNQYTQTLWKQMLHRINHASYHRGQIVTMLRQLGAKPQGTDLITYFRLEKK